MRSACLVYEASVCDLLAVASCSVTAFIILTGFYTGGVLAGLYVGSTLFEMIEPLLDIVLMEVPMPLDILVSFGAFIAVLHLSVSTLLTIIRYILKIILRTIMDLGKDAFIAVTFCLAIVGTCATWASVFFPDLIFSSNSDLTVGLWGVITSGLWGILGWTFVRYASSYRPAGRIFHEEFAFATIRLGDFSVRQLDRR